ncbi:unnamed protein product [Amoebophrya sp. A25]|nr:unnamed protein product [Amoebophrya sp. A25]|eukprot:GSA25T00000560001.1
MNSFLFDILLPCMKGVSVSDWADRKPGGLTSRRKSLQVFIARHYDHGCFLLKKEADASKWLVRRAQANLDGDKPPTFWKRLPACIFLSLRSQIAAVFSCDVSRSQSTQVRFATAPCVPI